MQVFIRNHGDPLGGTRHVKGFAIEGWPHPVAVGERIAVDDDILGYMGRPLGPGSALTFGLFLAGLWNKRDYPRPWISLEDGDGKAIDQDGNVVVAPPEKPPETPSGQKTKEKAS